MSEIIDWILGTACIIYPHELGFGVVDNNMKLRASSTNCGRCCHLWKTPCVVCVCYPADWSNYLPPICSIQSASSILCAILQQQRPMRAADLGCREFRDYLIFVLIWKIMSGAMIRGWRDGRSLKDVNRLGSERFLIFRNSSISMRNLITQRHLECVGNAAAECRRTWLSVCALGFWPLRWFCVCTCQIEPLTGENPGINIFFNMSDYNIPIIEPTIDYTKVWLTISGSFVIVLGKNNLKFYFC